MADDKIEDTDHAGSVRERPPVDAPPPNTPGDQPEKRVLLADPGLAATTSERARLDAPAAGDARSKRKPQAERELVPDPREQMLRKQLDEFRAEHASRIKPSNGAEWLGSVVAAAVGSAIVHIGRQEYVEVALPAGVAPPEVGANVAIGREGELTPVAAHHEMMREITPHERSL